MSEAIEEPRPSETGESQRDRSLRHVGNVSYALHAVVALAALLPGVQASVGLLLVAFILDMVKRGDALGSWQASHFGWRIRTVLCAGAFYAITAPLWLLFVAPGWIAWGLVSVWFAYRIVRGWLALNDRRPMPG